MSEVAERVKNIIVEHLGVDEDKVTETASFIDDLGADGLDTVNWLWRSKKNSDVRSPTTSGKNLTVKDAVDFSKQG